MSGFLIDTNVVSELRKRDRADEGVRNWFDSADDTSLWLSVLVVGELRRGVALIARRDPDAAEAIGSWLDSVVEDYEDRILPVTSGTAERWALITVPDAVPVVTGLLAATAIEHGLTLVTRNVADVANTGVVCLDPFGSAGD
ncbi:MAG: type II toxin-antitoxin system VapC family toxin [Acidimicrobiales bacterium]